MSRCFSQYLQFRRGLVDGGDWVLIAGGVLPATRP
jgi:hypothetical protein